MLWTTVTFDIPLGTIKASQVVALNEDSVVVTQWKLMRTAWSSSSNWIWLRWETYTLKVVFVEHHTHFNVYVSQRSQIQFEVEDHAVYISFRWVTTTCLRWEPQPVTLWLYPVYIYSWVETWHVSSSWGVDVQDTVFLPTDPGITELCALELCFWSSCGKINTRSLILWQRSSCMTLALELDQQAKSFQIVNRYRWQVSICL